MAVKRAAWVMVWLAAGGMLALAHHGTSTYDMTTEFALTGQVREWSFRNPHSWLHLTVTRPGGAVEEWSIESAPPDYLARQGWSASTLKTGEAIGALVSPLKGEQRRAILLEVTRGSGETLIVRPRGAFGRPQRVK
jgi:hypothetical protein